MRVENAEAKNLWGFCAKCPMHKGWGSWREEYLAKNKHLGMLSPSELVIFRWEISGDLVNVVNET